MSLLAAAAAGCSDNVPTATTTATTTAVPTVPAVLSLGTDKSAIVTDNSTAATLTATMVDSSNAVMAGVVVNFSTTSGNLSASSATTDANGQAIVLLKSGISDFSNRTATVTATQGAQSASLPILIKGSTVALTVSPASNIQVGAGTLTATALATDAAGLGKFNQTIRFSVGAASTGLGTLSSAALITDSQGVTPTLTFTPTQAGTVVLTAEWLDAAGGVTATATQNITVEAASGVAFAITIPVANPAPLTSGATQALAVTVPTTIGGVTVTSTRISASSGTWTGTNPATGPLTSIMQTPAANAVAATYTAPLNAGTATVQVDALDASGATLGTVTRTFAVSAPSSAAAKIFLGASASTIVPSSGGNISTSTLKVTVRDANNNAVGGAAVMFGLLGTTGSGESVSPAVAITDSAGEATTTFSAGSSPTLAAIYAQASIVGQTCAFSPKPLTAETNALCDAAPMMVSSSAVSVTVGFGTKIADTANSTQYMLPGSVLVVNSNGSPVAGVPVTLTVFPVEYRNGIITSGKVWNGSSWLWECTGPFNTSAAPTWSPGALMWIYSTATEFTAAEDRNRDGILDAGEDTTGNGVIDTIYSEDTNLNGLLDYGEDLNRNGTLDAGEDLDADGILDTEDTNNNGLLDVFTEDKNGNGLLDPGEDTAIASGPRAAQAQAANGLLSPAQAAGGTVPLTVTTDANGAATFNLQYPKSSARFIKDEVSARVIVMGTESTAKTTLELPMSMEDNLFPTCPLGREGSY